MGKKCLYHDILQYIVVIGMAVGGISVAAAVGLRHNHCQIIAPHQQLNDAFADVG